MIKGTLGVISIVTLIFNMEDIVVFLALKV